MHDDKIESKDERESGQWLAVAFGDELPPDIESAMERQYRWAEAALSQQHPPRTTRTLRTAMATFGLCAIAAAGWIAFDGLWQPKITWAEVVDSFGSVTSLAITIFDSSHGRDVPKRIDYWVGPGGRVRIHDGDLVIIGVPDSSVTAFDTVSGKRFNPDTLTPEEKSNLNLSPALAFSDFLAESGNASLEKILSQFVGDGVALSPELNAVPSVSRDLLVFDTGGGQEGSWQRVWALRESRLPVRARSWDADDGGSTEILFDYASEQPEEAFDPDAYANALGKGVGTVNRRFALLRDPAGQLITPADVHAEVGYHLPDVQEWGHTAEGVVWIQSHNSTNRTPEGHDVKGFGKLEDNHGQVYLHQRLGSRVRDDMTLECFIPLNLGLDYQRPATLTLTAWSQPDNPMQPVYEFGSVPLELTDAGSPIPNNFDNAPTAQEALRTVIAAWARREKWDNFDRLLATIPGEPERDAMALFRDSRRLEKLSLMGQNDAAFALSSRLVPIVVAGAQGFPWEYATVIQNHVLQLVRRGELAAATELLAPYRAELRTEESSTRTFHFVTDLVSQIERVESNANVVPQVLGFDPRTIPAMVEQLNMMRGSGFMPASEDPRLQPWRDFVAGAARHYDVVPLPETYDVLSDPLPFPLKMPTYSVDLPNAPDYTITRFGPDWLSMARTQAYATGKDPDRILVDPALRDSSVNLVVVSNKTLSTEELLTRLAAREGVVFRETTKQERVWVAQYDGRPLPYWREVRPADVGENPAIRGGGTQSTAKVVLKMFEESMNRQANTNERVIVLDETGLPDSPGENQTRGTICLSYQYAFGTGSQAVEIATNWFRDNFGITFTEEVRDVPMLEVAPAP